MPTNTPMFSAGAPRTEVKYPFTRISWPSRVRVTAAGSFKSALLTPKRAPVITLMRIKAMTAAKAPPARSFAQEPPMATANRMCRLLITAQPMVSMVLPIVRTAPISPPAICMSFPTLIISPAAGMTAMTVIRTLPSFWRKSKLTRDFLGFPAFLSAASAGEDVFAAGAVSGLWGEAASASSAASGGQWSKTVITVSAPAFTGPVKAFMERPSIPPQIRTGVMVLTCFSSRAFKSAFARRLPAFTLSPIFTQHWKHSPFKATVSRPKWTMTSMPSSERRP